MDERAYRYRVYSVHPLSRPWVVRDHRVQELRNKNAEVLITFQKEMVKGRTPKIIIQRFVSEPSFLIMK